MSTLRARKIFNDSKHQLIVVESADKWQRKSNFGCYSYVRIEPLAIVVLGPDAKIQAFDMSGKQVAIDLLEKSVSKLSELISSSIKR